MIVCDGCRKEKTLQFSRTDGDRINQCTDCFEYMKHVRSVSIQPVPWGLAEARRGGFASH